MKIMIRAHDLGVRGEGSIRDEIARLGLDGVQLVVYKAAEDVKYEPGAITNDRAEIIGKTITQNGAEIALIGAYFNPVHPNGDKVQKGIKVFKDYLDCAKSIGCSFVGSETGSYNGDPWIYHPMNHSDEALDRVVDTFGELSNYAKERGVCIGMEGAFGHVCHTPERLDLAIKRIGTDNIKVIFDLYNYLDISNYEEAYDILKRGLDLFGDRILLFHIKDFTVGEEKLIQCGVGHGVLDYSRIINAIYNHNPEAVLVLEGTVGEDIPYAIEFLRNKIKENHLPRKE